MRDSFFLHKLTQFYTQPQLYSYTRFHAVFTQFYAAFTHLFTQFYAAFHSITPFYTKLWWFTQCDARLQFCNTEVSLIITPYTGTEVTDSARRGQGIAENHQKALLGFGAVLRKKNSETHSGKTHFQRKRIQDAFTLLLQWVGGWAAKKTKRRPWLRLPKKTFCLPESSG